MSRMEGTPTANKMAAIEMVIINSIRVKPCTAYGCSERNNFADDFSANIFITLHMYLTGSKCKQSIFFGQYLDDEMNGKSDERLKTADTLLRAPDFSLNHAKSGR